MLERLKILSELPGVSGNETAVRAYLKKDLAFLTDRGAEILTDPVGNLYVHKPGKGPKIMICAHMDEVGMIVKRITDSGTLLYDACGMDPRVVVGKRVIVGKNKVPGIISCKAIHLQTPEERKRALKHTELYADIGAKDRADAEKLVSKGDYISFTTKFEDFGDGLVKGKALDDRVGCAILTELLRQDYDCDFWGVFTVQEELGLRGSGVAARFVTKHGGKEEGTAGVQPLIALCLEGTTANDVAGILGHQSVTTLGKGAAISFMDRSNIVPERLLKALIGTAEAAGIPWQLRKGNAGGTDSGSIRAIGTGVLSGTVSVPCRYIHSPVSLACKSDIKAVYELADAFLRRKVYADLSAAGAVCK